MKMSMAEYLERPEISASALCQIMKNAKKYKLMKDGVINHKSKEKDIGTCVHTLVLEPENAKDVFIVDDSITEDVIKWGELEPDSIVIVEAESRRHGEFQKAKKSNPGKTCLLVEEFDLVLQYMKHRNQIILTSEDMALVRTLVAKVKELPGFEKYLNNGHKELSFFGEFDDVKLKCRPDLLYELGPRDTDGLIPVIVFDLKSMFSEINGNDFARASGENKYYLSEALYRHVLMQNGYNVVGYNFVGVSKVEWSGAQYFEHDDAAIMHGDKVMRYAIIKYKHCLETNNWSENEFDFYDKKFLAVTRVNLPTYIYYQDKLPEEM